MEPSNLWLLVNETVEAFERLYQGAQDQAFNDVEAQIAGVGAFPLSLVRSSDPEPFPIERFTEMYPWNSVTAAPRVLDQLAEQGIVQGNGDAYCLSPGAKSALDQIHKVAPHGVTAGLMPLPDDKMKRLTELLGRIIQACLADAAITGKWGLSHTFWMYPDDPSALAPQIE